ncbi:type III PLP-dependent enzyme [Symbioplanes lichenis]|uniref:type III PLP-dependent enzyme n=1 Tax=Symbioplanes lichenis TaxID=1629072 RepID=UPI002739FF1F|nr:type III PLP-dependent enzyme [Actinoplanes lichenis]
MSASLKGPSISGRPMTDVDLVALAGRVSTPLVVHDLAVLRRRAAALRGVLPGPSTLLYSLKANPCPPVVAALQAAGCGSEISSAGELAVALGTGHDPGPMLYTGPGKSAADLTAAAEAGAILSCESPAEVTRAREVLRPSSADPLRIILRVQPGVRTAAGLSMADGRQFGLLEAEAGPFCRDLPADVEVLGFHIYLGSQMPGTPALAAAFEQAAETVHRITAEAGVRPRIVDLGGGFPWPYAAPGEGPGLADLPPAIEKTVDRLARCGAEAWFESGRGLVAAAGRLLTTVMDVKQRGGTTLVVADAGVNVLGGMSGLGRVLRPDTVFRNLSAPDREQVKVDVVGPLCSPLDRLAVGTRMASPRIGDVLCVDNVGAYATTAALTGFLSRPAATEVAVDGPSVVEGWTLRTGHERVTLGPA